MPNSLLCATVSCLALVGGAAWCAPASAQAPAAETIDSLAASVAELRAQLAAQKAVSDRQAQEIARLRFLSDGTLDETRGRGDPVQQGPGDAAPIAQIPAAQRLTVGAPPPPAEPVEVAAVPEGHGVLTPRGRGVIEPSFDFTHGSTNRLVFRGVEIVTGIQIGVIEASDADRNALTGALSLRYGLLDRLEMEVRAPYVYRDDRVTTLAQRDETITRTYHLEGQGVGDVELSGRYQLNRGLGGWPIFIAGLRYKSDTGTSPFEVERDQFGVATELATGSGFWALEGSLNFLYPTDPIVLFGGLNYISHQPKHIERVIGEVLVRKIDPGDSVGLNVGFGFALNPRFSFSLGYKHTYIWPTKSVLGNTLQDSESLQVGAFTFGWSLALTDRVSIANSYEVGATSDAPDMRVVLRVPVRF